MHHEGSLKLEVSEKKACKKICTYYKIINNKTTYTTIYSKLNHTYNVRTKIYSNPFIMKPVIMKNQLYLSISIPLSICQVWLY